MAVNCIFSCYSRTDTLGVCINNSGSGGKIESGIRIHQFAPHYPESVTSFVNGVMLLSATWRVCQPTPAYQVLKLRSILHVLTGS